MIFFAYYKRKNSTNTNICTAFIICFLLLFLIRNRDRTLLSTRKINGFWEQIAFYCIIRVGEICCFAISVCNRTNQILAFAQRENIKISVNPTSCFYIFVYS